MFIEFIRELSISEGGSTRKEEVTGPHAQKFKWDRPMAEESRAVPGSRFFLFSFGWRLKEENIDRNQTSNQSNDRDGASVEFIDEIVNRKSLQIDGKFGVWTRVNRMTSSPTGGTLVQFQLAMRRCEPPNFDVVSSASTTRWVRTNQRIGWAAQLFRLVVCKSRQLETNFNEFVGKFIKIIFWRANGTGSKRPISCISFRSLVNQFVSVPFFNGRKTCEFSTKNSRRISDSIGIASETPSSASSSASIWRQFRKWIN